MSISSLAGITTPGKFGLSGESLSGRGGARRSVALDPKGGGRRCRGLTSLFTTTWPARDCSTSSRPRPSAFSPASRSVIAS